MTSTSIDTRPAQLAPVRIGQGQRVHLGSLSSLRGPDGAPRYTASRCSAGSRDAEVVTVGAAVAEQIDCRTCQRAQPFQVELLNAAVIAATTGPVTLPHSRLTVPHDRLHVAEISMAQSQDISLWRTRATTTTRAQLNLGDHFAGWIDISNQPASYLPGATFQFGRGEMEAYAAQCRLFTGEPADLSEVLDDLVYEHLISTFVAARLANRQVPVRLMAQVLTGDDQPVGEPYPIAYEALSALGQLMSDAHDHAVSAGWLPPISDPRWHRAITRCLHRAWPCGAGQHWQLWTPDGWTRLPGVDEVTRAEPVGHRVNIHRAADRPCPFSGTPVASHLVRVDAQRCPDSRIEPNRH